MLSYFGCDQSQVQRYLSGANLAQSRLSLLFNAFLKVPMQFMILLTGVLVFVFYHFHPPPLLWNSRAETAITSGIPAAELDGLRTRFDAAWSSREQATRAYLKTRDASHLAEYQAASGALTGCGWRRSGTCRRDGTCGLQRHQLHLPDLHRVAAAARHRRPGHRRDLRGGDVDAVGRAQLTRHREHGRFLQALPEARRQRPRRHPGVAHADGVLGVASPAASRCTPDSSAPRSRW